MTTTTAAQVATLTGATAARVECPATDCTVEGTIPGVRRHMARFHGEHRSPRDKALVIDHPLADSRYSHGNPTPCRAKTPVGIEHYATKIDPASNPGRPLATYKRVSTAAVLEALGVPTN